MVEIPIRILHGNLRDPGHFDECVKFRHDEVQGQHCMITSTANGHENATNYTRFDWRWIGKVVQENELILGHGICLPAVCSSEKVIDYAKKILSQAGLEAVNAVCRTNDAISFQAIDILAL